MQSNSHFASTSTRIPEIHAPSLGLGQFNLQTLKRDAPAGIITGLMAIPLSVGICLMSDYPIQVGLMTVIVACLVSFLFYLIRPGNHIGVPGVAAGLAPVLAMGIHKYGMERMPWIIFLTSMMQMLVWRYRLEGYILKAVPKFLIEGLLAGVGLKIAMKFIPYTYAISTQSGEHFWSNERLIVVMSSIVALLLFVYLYKRFKDKSPGIPYIAVIGGGAWLGTFIHFPMLEIDHVNFHWAVPWREVIDLTKTSLSMHLEMFLFSAMLMLIDVIEQVMSNAAIQSIDPLGRKSDSNNSLLVMWFANGISSFFGGMTNLDGLAKSSTNQMAGAVTKMSVLFVAMVLGVVLYFPIILSSLPEFSLAVLMIFTGWKMIAGLYHVAQYGKYEFGLAMFCGILVFRLGIFEGLLICLALHSFIVYIIYRHEKIPTFAILKKLVVLFSDAVHPHSSETLLVHQDHISGGYRYSSLYRSPTEHKSLDDFISDWAYGINHHNLLSVVGTYDLSGILWGTFARELRVGHSRIKGYFEHLFELDNLAVKFDSGETRQYHDVYIRSGSYQFSYQKKGNVVHVPARYSFVCKKEKTGWYILEHHSSEFPA